MLRGQVRKCQKERRGEKGQGFFILY